MHIDIDLDWWSSILLGYLLHPLITVILCLLSVFVVLGNLLVVSAIWHENQLHSVTNYLIASLAAADCLVGALVMPFSIISEIIIGSWTFGAVWCDLWHSLDVLASTASIMNLCAISLDRYLAITNPISYPARMTPKRVALLIVSVWTASSVISFPAIFWWRKVSPSPLEPLLPEQTSISPPNSSLSTVDSTGIKDLSIEIRYKCVFTNNALYLLFSSLVSFYGPLCVMLYAYYRIYKAAVQQTRFLKHGSKQVMIGKSGKSKRCRYTSERSAHGNDKDGDKSQRDDASNNESFGGQHLVLRAHRGGGGGSSTNASRKTVKGELSGSSRPSNEHKSSQDANCARKSFDTDKASGGTTSRLSTGLDKCTSMNLSYSFSQENNSVSRNEQAAIRKNQIKVDCQRFDARPRSLDMAIDQRTKLRDLAMPSISSHETELCMRQTVGESLAETRIPGLKKNDCVIQYEPQTSPLLASINDRLTSVDVSSTNRSQRLDTQASRCQVFDPSFIKTIDISESYRSNIDNFQNSSSTSLSCKDDSLSGYSASDYEGKVEDSNASEQVSSSSGSYGTGSIASVMFRPQQNQYRTDEKSSNKNNCDSEQNGRTVNAKFRRALSIGDVLRKDTSNKMKVCSSTDRNGRNLTNQSNSADKRYRASCCDPTTRAEVISNLKSSKTMSIRSWVKLARRPRKQDNTSNNRFDKPPPSLLPLMLMNSDTSTDSSVITCAARKIDIESGIDCLPKVDSTGFSDNHFHLKVDDVEFIQRTQSLNLEHYSTDNDSISTNDKNFTTKSGSVKSGELAKGQMLYYDSDKLIQSIVDLTAINYIDSSSQTAAAPIEQGDSIITTCSEMKEKRNLDSSEPTQAGDIGQTNAPRQHRSVGKKLSKLAKERKAAKTLGCVVGVFTLCWMPFFVINILVALCGTDCIHKPDLLVPVFTWLGWLNSAMNPVIYACWSRDFRRAFRRVLCSWVEFVCPYGEAYLARKLKLKKNSNYSPHEVYLNRALSGVKANASSTARSGVSLEGRAYGNTANGAVTQVLLSDQF